MKKEGRPKLLTIGIVVFLLWLLAYFMSTFIPLLSSQPYLTEGNVALIRISGVIVAESQDSFFGGGVMSSTDIIRLIEKADKNPKIDAILLEINSPGGSPVGSYEISKAVRELNKTCVAYIREVGASGAYWVASSAEYVVANPLSFTGSIGVISSYLEFSGLMEKYGVGYERLVAGEYKDTGSPYRNLTEEEKEILQEKLDKVHDFFITKVAENRGMDKADVEEIATGMFYLGMEAKEIGLVDAVGDMETAKEYIEDKLETEGVQLAEYKKGKSFFSMFAKMMNENFFFLGQGLASSNLGQRMLVRT